MISSVHAKLSDQKQVDICGCAFQTEPRTSNEPELIKFEKHLKIKIKRIKRLFTCYKHSITFP